MDPAITEAAAVAGMAAKEAMAETGKAVLNKGATVDPELKAGGVALVAEAAMVAAEKNAHSIAI